MRTGVEGSEEKFGPSAPHTETVQNGFGASWDITLNLWTAKNGTLINYAVHVERAGGCVLTADTQKFHVEYEERVHKKVQF